MTKEMLTDPQLPSDWNAQHRRICYVSDESHRNLFGNKQNVVFCMSDDSTASDLCQEIKSLTGSSVRLFRRPARVVGSEFLYDINGSGMEDSQRLFYESNLNDIYDVPYFEILTQEPKFKIAIRIPTNKILKFSVGKSTSISKIHRALQDPTGIPAFAQRLLYRGNRVSETIGAHNIGPVSSPYIVLLVVLMHPNRKNTLNFMFNRSEVVRRVNISSS